MSTPIFWIALLFIFAGLFGVFAVLIGFRKDTSKGRLEERLSAYTVAPPVVEAAPLNQTALGSTTITRRTVGIADRMVAKRGFEENLTNSLSAAAVKLRPGEWLVLHLLATIGTGVVVSLLSGFSLIAGVLGLGLGFAVPNLFLSLKKGRRRKAFYSALPDTLQMIAGSLSAGHSLPQAFDAVAGESDGAMGDELNRAIVEARLGADLEDSLNAVAVRMDSKDMAWVVMAIRTQREVGGNLAEVLTTVADTLRSRERLRRQVSALSAEGKLSALIIGVLPILFALYLSIARPDYLNVLFTDPLGITLVVVGAGLFIAGIFWLRATVKVEV